MISQWMKSGHSASWEQLADALGLIQSYGLATGNRLRQAVGLPAGNVYQVCGVTVLLFRVNLYYMYTKHFPNMQRDVWKAVPNVTETRFRDGSVQATQAYKDCT